MSLHPYIAERIHLLHEMDTVGGFDSVEGNAAWDRFFEVPESYSPPAVDVKEAFIARKNGERDLRVIVYRSASDSMGPGLVWMHGGAFAGGSVDMFEADGAARELAARTEGTVISVDYRLVSATVTFPDPFDDVALAWSWARENAQSLGIDQGRLALGGASAGAALAAGSAVALRDSRGALPSILVLAYPSVHPVLPPFSHELAAKTRELPDVINFSPSPDDVRDSFVLRGLLGGPEWTVTSHAMAGLAELGGMPRTLILNAEYDPLRASGERFAADLALAGTDVEVVQVKGVVHGHLNLPPVLEPVEDSLRLIAERLRERN